jgi:hypothetical protein
MYTSSLGNVFRHHAPSNPSSQSRDHKRQMSFSIFASDANPAIDRRIGKISNARAAEQISQKLAIQIGPRQLQLLPTRPTSTDQSNTLTMLAGGSFDSAWSIRMSGFAGPLVWQLHSPRNPL